MTTSSLVTASKIEPTIANVFFCLGFFIIPPLADIGRLDALGAVITVERFVFPIDAGGDRLELRDFVLVFVRAPSAVHAKDAVLTVQVVDWITAGPSPGRESSIFVAR